MNESQGILIDNHVSVFSGPFQKNDAILFRVNEGTKVEILVWENQWVEIILIDGKKGWIPAETLRKL
ncbi:MAG: SH3 domain-containing protein [Candidatus Marinimicrobia bacterium]|nr:SH3 domain-containing protein [Candidatus Neomarinimicrobiota bacterium]